MKSLPQCSRHVPTREGLFKSYRNLCNKNRAAVPRLVYKVKGMDCGRGIFTAFLNGKLDFHRKIKPSCLNVPSLSLTKQSVQCKMRIDMSSQSFNEASEPSDKVMQLVNSSSRILFS